MKRHLAIGCYAHVRTHRHIGTEMDREQINVLFVCSRNQWRSPTAERMFKGDPMIVARSAGTRLSAPGESGHRV